MAPPRSSLLRALALLLGLAFLLLLLRAPIERALRGSALDAPLRIVKRHADAVTRAATDCDEREPSPNAPSLLIIGVDTLRADHLGFLGRRDRKVSPHIDALASESWIFRNAIAPATWTMPAFAGMLTGVSPAALGIDEKARPLPRSVPTLAEHLCEAGYDTAGIVSHTDVGRRYGFDRGFERWDETNAAGRAHVSSDAVTEAAVGALQEFADAGRPFFLFVHYFDPHDDYREHAEHTYTTARARADRSGTDADDIRELRALARRGELAAATLREVRDHYDSEIAFTDAAIGRLLDQATELGLFGNSLIVFVADHGELFAERPDAWIGHTRSVHQAVLHVPLLLKLPDQSPDAQRHDRNISYTVSTLDIAATALDALGVRREVAEALPASLAKRPGIIGRSLLDRRRAQRLVFAQTRKEAERDAILDGRLKLIVDRESGDRELYDLKTDPGERNDLSARAPRLADQLEKNLDRWIEDTRRLSRHLEEHD